MGTEDLTAIKPMRQGVFDISGGAVEWNVAPGLTNKDRNQVCTDKVCTITNTYTVGTKGKQFDDNNICSGNMLWSYLHQHNGAISGTMSVNGKLHCTSTPKVGTDASNPIGNEKGYTVGFDVCVD